MIPDMLAKAAYNSLVKSFKKPLTSQNTLEKSLHISNVDWHTIYMIPQKVTIESSLRIFNIKFSTIFYFWTIGIQVRTGSVPIMFTM